MLLYSSRIYIYISEVGEVSPTGKSYSFRSFVRACVRACVRCDAKLRVPAGRCCFRGWVAKARIILRRRRVGASARALAWPGWLAWLGWLAWAGRCCFRGWVAKARIILRRRRVGACPRLAWLLGPTVRLAPPLPQSSYQPLGWSYSIYIIYVYLIVDMSAPRVPPLPKF
jgi:hypothetical protein